VTTRRSFSIFEINLGPLMRYITTTIH
jgi:hypothetical protein